MLKIKSIALKNFLSIGQVTQAIKLDNDGLTLVLGANLDTQGGSTRNGAGKTTILQGISYALFGSPLTKIKVDNLVNNINDKQMLVVIEFEKDGQSYKIERGRKPNVLKYFVNNKEQRFDESQGENKHTQEEIERCIGITHNMFKHIVALNTFTEPFLTMSVGKQREVIEELLGVTQISQRADSLRKNIQETKDNIKTQEAHISAITEANNRINRMIEQQKSLSAAWEKQHSEKINQLSEEIDTMKDIDFSVELSILDEIEKYDSLVRDFNTEIYNIENQYKTILREIEYIDQSGKTDNNINTNRSYIKRLEDQLIRADKDIQRLVDQKSSNEKSIEKLEVLLSEQKKELENAENALNSDDHKNCAVCGQGLAGTDHLAEVIETLKKNVGQCYENIKKTNASIDDLTKRNTEIDNDIITFNNEKTNITKEITEISKHIDELIAAQDKTKEENDAKILLLNENISELDIRKKNIQNDISAIGDKPSSLFSSKDELYEMKQLRDSLEKELAVEIEKTNHHDEQIISLSSTVQELDYEPLNYLNNLHKHQDFLLRLLTNKDSFVRKAIIDQNLYYLNTRLNGYLDKLGLPHEVKFLSDLSVEITLLGRDFDFAQLSRGEMNRVILATSWSFRDVWESLNHSINLMFVDELIDNGTDDQGAEAALNILKKMVRDRGKNIFLISHKDHLVSRVGRILMVHKENSFTRFEEDAEL